ncbi:MAG: hypothetical protein JRF63_00790 [Deltaproteobacteria bacterium]|nr:hypothetical protein [Deltaproteobacteria bacterium]
MRRAQSSLALAALALASTTCFPSSVTAYSVATGGYDPCHEEFTGRAYQNVELQWPSPTIPIPGDDTWRELAGALIKKMGLDPKQLDEAQRFMLVSLLIGARAPDTDGHSLLSLQNLRAVHGDPSPEGQYAHCLRGPDDDYGEGDAAAVTGTRVKIAETVQKAADSLAEHPDDQLIKKTIYLDFYGLVDVRVWAPAYYVGFASHTVHDSFSHAVRIESTEFRKIALVMNYIDAISYDFKEKRDGLAHSETFDKCFKDELQPLVTVADEGTAAFFTAVNAQLGGSDPSAVQAFLDEWITLEPGCDESNEWCDSAYWVELAREEQTGPYMASLFGCSASRAGTTSPNASLALFTLFVAFLITRRVGRRR